MLKKTERLSRTEFTHYFKVGKRSNTEYLTIVHSPATCFKASVVVGKKVYKEAVDRNRLKRQVYAKLRDLKAQSTGVFLVLVKPPLAKLTKAKQKQALTTELGAVIN
jgi:ribonuclease P protein component